MDIVFNLKITYNKIKTINNKIKIINNKIKIINKILVENIQ